MAVRSILLLLLAAALAGCSAGGSSSPAATVPASAKTVAAKATGVEVIQLARKKTSVKRARKPAYISSAATSANLSIDGALNSGTCSGDVCTIPWTSTPGPHTFTAEIDDGTNILAAGSAPYTLVPGNNDLSPLTLNGVAVSIVFPSGASVDQSGTFSIADFDGIAITTPGTFDNLEAVSSSSGVGIVATNLTTTGVYANPDPVGTDYTFSVSCVSGATGTFTVSATTAAPVASGMGPTFFGLLYPTISVSADTYTCTNGVLGVAYGTLGFTPNTVPSGTITEYTVSGPSSGPTFITSGSDGNLWFLANTYVDKMSTAGVLMSAYSIPGGNNDNQDITSGTDGNIWFSSRGANQIDKVTPAGAISQYNIPTSNSGAYGIASGPDGKLYFPESDSLTTIGQITTGGVITEYPGSGAGNQPEYITQGPDGNMWFTLSTGYGNALGSITTSGVVTDYPLFANSYSPLAIASGPDGNLWVTSGNSNSISKVSTAPALLGQFTVPTANAFPYRIAAGPDGNVWFTEYQANKIGKITPSGTITEYPIPTPSSNPSGITLGPDGNMWFTEPNKNKIGKIAP